MTQELLKKIKSRGYWRVSIRPTEFEPDRISIIACDQIVRDSTVSLRGWDYPHYPTQEFDYQGLYTYDNYVESRTDWQRYKEIWRMYQSAQFIQYLGLREDWLDEDGWHADGEAGIEPKSVLGMVGTIYTITEVYEFLKRLVSNGLYEQGASVEISLKNTENRQIVIFERPRGRLYEDYVTSAQEINVPKKLLTADELVEDSNELAINAVQHLFERFGWKNQPVDVFVGDQVKLLEKRL